MNRKKDEIDIEINLTLWQSLKPFIKLSIIMLCVGMISVLIVTTSFALMGFKELGIIAIYLVVVITVVVFIMYMSYEIKKDKRMK